MIHLPAQVPDATQVIETAAQHGWEAGVVVLVLVAAMTGLFLLMRWQMKDFADERMCATEREKGMLGRINALDEMLKETTVCHAAEMKEMTFKVATALADNTRSIDEFRGSMERLGVTMGEINGDIKEVCRKLTESIEDEKG